MNKIGCFGWLAIFFVIGSIANALKTPTGASILGAIVLVTIIIVVLVKKDSWGKGKNHSAELLVVADQLDAWAASDTEQGTALTKSDEVALFDLPNIELLDFKSTGSTYSGGSVGVSFPIVGRIRGNVGGHQGQVTRNPEELMVVDTGTLKITSKRIIYVGVKEAREIAIAKLLDVELGPNGLWAKLAVSNKTKREGFQHMAVDQIPLGMAIGVANEWANGGKEAAVKYAKNTAAEIRSVLAAEAAAKLKKVNNNV